MAVGRSAHAMTGGGCEEYLIAMALRVDVGALVEELGHDAEPVVIRRKMEKGRAVLR